MFRGNIWENQYLTHINREMIHSPWGAYENLEQAFGCNRKISKNVLPLDGIWKFKLYETPLLTEDFFAEGFDVSEWSKITVPGNWENHGFSKPIYTNYMNPFDLDANEKYSIKPSAKSRDFSDVYKSNPPYVPANNPTGCYFKEFDIPAQWEQNRIFINFGGVESCYYLWVNGQFVGFSKDSKLPSDFEITDYIKTGTNTIAVKVLRFCDGTWIEDQDYWYLAGIFRPVTVICKPNIHIRDYFIKSEPIQFTNDGKIEAEIFLSLKDFYSDYKVSYKLLDADKNIVYSEEKYPVTDAKYNIKSVGAAKFTAVIKNINRWSPDIPYLYTSIITLISPDGLEIDIEASKTGFRKIEIKNNVVYFNFKRMIVRGVNRHEHALETGRAVSEEHMIKEIMLMKQLNFNAVRTCHYPDDPRWYELCDEYGICLVCEANVESHGIDGMLSCDPSWSGTYLERAVRMVMVHKNHPSIFSWSLGNESNTGANHSAMANWIRFYDDSRLVQYESGMPAHIVSDIRGNMYAPPNHVINMLADANDTRPIILVEYLYQIRNSGGGMDIFYELLERFERFQGGFVWDWQDKALYADDGNGNKFAAYGGDFGEEIIEKYEPPFMTCNGVVLPDLTPKPVAYEIKNVQSPIYFENYIDSNIDYFFMPRFDPTKGLFVIKNRNIEQDSSCYALRYEILENGSIKYSGYLDMPLINAMENGVLNLDLDAMLPDKCRYSEYFINFYIDMAVDTSYVKAGHNVYFSQFLLQPAQIKSDAVQNSNEISKPAINETNNAIIVSGDNFEITFSKSTAAISSYVKDGCNYITESAKENLYRPASGIDAYRNWGLYAVWQQTLLPSNVTRKNSSLSCHTIGDNIEVKASFISTSKESKIISITDISYTIKPDGQINIETSIDIDKSIEYIPRVGLELILPKSFETIEWYGRGINESYSDRLKSAIIGNYKQTVTEQHIKFIPPSECGGHEDTRQLILSDTTGHSITITSGSPFHFDAKHHSLTDYNVSHEHLLTEQNATYVHIDHLHSGIGGNMGWSTSYDKNHLVKAAAYKFGFNLKFR